GLTRLSCSSAALSASVWQRVEQRFGIPVINLYGSSEAGWICGADQHNRQIGSVGFAAPGVRLERMACPGGQAPGQLRIHAEHLALAVQSLDQSVPQQLDGRLMIADQVRINEDGRVFLFGRTDDIINRSGIKIHPAVIEESIVQHPLVRQAVVFGVDHAETGQAIACAVVGDPRLDLATLQDYVARQSGLPASHQPLHWWMVEEVPYVGNGKISRQALAQRFHARFS
ncbi:MAG: AMP-binding protein, partial [Pigmentiphaga sp.]